jgi:hypothetical protein
MKVAALAYPSVQRHCTPSIPHNLYSKPNRRVLQKTVNASQPDEVALSGKPFENSKLYVADEAYS